VLLVRPRSANVICWEAPLRTSPSSGQATASSLFRPDLSACHSGAALDRQSYRLVDKEHLQVAIIQTCKGTLVGNMKAASRGVV